jgi:hypothetical protein
MRSNKPQVIRYYDRFAVIGTSYGHLHTTSGDWATWKTASGARKAIKRYVPFSSCFQKSLDIIANKRLYPSKILAIIAKGIS